MNQKDPESIKLFSVPRMLANFTFDCLKNNKRLEDEGEVHRSLDNAVNLINCLEEKDRFLHNF